MISAFRIAFMIIQGITTPLAISMLATIPTRGQEKGWMIAGSSARATPCAATARTENARRLEPSTMKFRSRVSTSNWSARVDIYHLTISTNENAVRIVAATSSCGTRIIRRRAITDSTTPMETASTSMETMKIPQSR